MKKLLVYPYEKGTVNIARYKHLLADYELESIVAPKGWRYGGKDASEIDGSKSIGFVVSEDFEESLKDCDAVLFTEGGSCLNGQYYKEKVELAVHNKKEIIVTSELQQQLEYEQIHFTGHKIINQSYEKPITLSDNPNKLFNINTPIIMVYGTGINSGKFDVQLLLREQFINDGYTVSQIGSKNFCELFGFHSFPSFMFSKELGIEEKTIAFNHYIYTMEQRENPDVIIIGIPGGIMPLCKLCNNHFGDLSYIVSHAAQPDISLLSMYYVEHMSSQYLKELALYCKYALGSELEYFFIGYKKLDIDYELEEIFYLPVSEEEVKAYIFKNQQVFEEAKVRVCSLFEQQSLKDVYKQLIEALSSEIAYVR